MDTRHLARSHEVGTKIGLIHQKRVKTALDQFSQRAGAALNGATGDKGADGHAMPAFNPWSFQHDAVDAFQRSILFWDTLRQRGDNFLERAAKGSAPVLHFDYETILDGRGFARPVNSALLRIVPPAGVTLDPAKRPYLIIDPRAGHGSGIGGFKDDSQACVAMRAGHPVYFVSFFRDPEPGQTLLDVCSAEGQFVQRVRALHPASEKPAIIGNCQGGWAAMMLAASSPDDTGPILISGAPMSYVSGNEGEGDNPMRYAGGMLGGTWPSSFVADLGNGIFHGAHLVQNFENLNPANSLWDKHYKVYAHADTEPPRYLDFERWWGTYYLLNREEIVPGYPEALVISDAAVNIAPTLEDKMDILQNAIDLAHALQFREVRVAVLSAMETVNPKVPSTIEAAALCKTVDRHQIGGALVDGPLALDNAIDPDAAKIKQIDSPVAGRANVLLVPDLEAGNMLAKSLSFLAGADAAGIVLGARVPIILTSRADPMVTRPRRESGNPAR